MRFGDPTWLQALWAAPILVLLWLISVRASRAALRRFADADLLPAIGGVPRFGRRVMRASAVVLALAIMAIALARPQWNPEEREAERRGRDIVFVVDVSRSMLAQDLAPNRLARVQMWIRDLVSSLQGDRVGLVAFAGAPVIKCPLTLDYEFFDMALEELSPNSAPRGGTNIGDAIRKTTGDVFEGDAVDTRFRDIILLTDGEDQESLPVAAAQSAGEMGVRIITIGIGSETTGATVPSADDSGGAMTFGGQVVRSRQDSATLERIAAASAGGVYLNVGTGTIDLEEVYEDLIRSAEQMTFETAAAVQYQEGFQVLLIVAFVLLIAEACIRDR